MLMIRKVVVTTLLMVFILNGMVTTKDGNAKALVPQIKGEFGVAIDVNTGEILYNKNVNSKANPASMTKVLTAIILDEQMKDGEMLTASLNAANQECVCFGLAVSERISKEDAMKALLLLSANDVAVAIAENVAGSEEKFAKLMNQKVKKLRLKNTHFVTASGLTDPEHYTTPYDMALIAKEALKHPKVLEDMSTQAAFIKTSIQEKNIINRNIKRCRTNVIASKTGYTEAAQYTLVQYLMKDNKEIICVVMKSDEKSRFNDIQTMANYSFAHMKKPEITPEVIEWK
ncbi:D-alanyl-D-alanine carboxypeptidase family protein [Bacillus sp. ISL-7]|uniref:D-alanyl-D-alanine carboxypeptidase family protein n=1 Tax=Bacillus sp. ISL-7 TaxID=2819136 RepID=UPI001BED05F4|nr:D-alanyl-D-alanine carboxypeptidase family protein [Bacillus sp. ISL-7]MBT2734784.1 D-alanyl-D-alanine carboxypeptidase [Bacillus sp. ISL-7]